MQPGHPKRAGGRISRLAFALMLVFAVPGAGQEQTREACQEAMIAQALGEEILGWLGSTRDTLFVKHAKYFMGNSSGQPDLSEESQKQLRIDLNKLSLTTQLISPVVTTTFGFPRVQPYRLLVEIDPASDEGAWACYKPRTILVSGKLLLRLWQNAAAESLEGNYKFKTVEEMIKAVTDFKPIKHYTYKEMIGNQDERIAETDQVGGSRLADAYPYTTKANLEYIKGILFVIAHESAHHWVDHCSRFSERKADLYGMLVSTTWMADQFRDVYSRAHLQRFVDYALSERNEAQRRLRENKYEPDMGLDDPLWEFDRETDRQTASETDEHLRQRIGREAGEERNRESFARLGFETFADVYERAEMSEYSAGDSAHQTLEFRRKELEASFAKEESLAEQLVLKKGSLSSVLAQEDRIRFNSTAKELKSLYKATAQCNLLPPRSPLP